jgi:hypothetical protein
MLAKVTVLAERGRVWRSEASEYSEDHEMADQLLEYLLRCLAQAREAPASRLRTAEKL